ncbi:N-6 DNA methylase [Ralstonia nicotianae]|uniref:site-specific DNA-methyltransferase (adenine-specific) n=1 Tax=Ralstonia pseudosolanacearum TaxID=1310165 RepID=A0A454TUF3_9RALS|nr:N-6 DNA methylase [Ralstonia pseudosolanacearum]MCK4132591.1 N-6 DNA methylase [Ralstonia pseudosolanacearum]MDK1380466.1 N-6 DNA methylase [Ralstonia pseudosolanacearum]RAA14669.1 SAM-dependent DNA methyltransferase [Ralstonia pseudosolanacearum]RNM08438.1 SAM-dependent DNA methyltransferase [Ralstonia pseudosolanacearum]
MSSFAFIKALTATGYLLPSGDAAPGLVRTGQDVPPQIRPAFSDRRVGLRADAVFSTHNVPTAIFKDAGDCAPTDSDIAKWHEAAWNIGVAPLLWIVTPTDIRLYDCYASPSRESVHHVATKPIDVFPLGADEKLDALDAMCGRFATETGAFWSSPIGKDIDRRHRVDRVLLAEINALEERLTLVSPASGKPLGDAVAEVRASRDFAQRLIGRCIFTAYLMDRGIAQPFLPSDFPADVAAMFGTVERAFSLFKWLRGTFNGDLFPMDDPGAEHQRLGEAHLALLRDFIEGRSLVSGQGRLFRFRFDAIPVDLVSSIYQQFARSSAADEAHVQGLHYTPVELVHLTLDPVFEGLHAEARVIDPTCGSGAFLVEAFRRLVWKRTRGAPATRGMVREVLYKQLYGIDINRSALGIAAFSLYLAALELDEEPVENISDLKFDRLIGTTLFQADTLADDLPTPVIAEPFDAIVGNPPWTFVRRDPSQRKRNAGNDETARPRRSPDQEFLWKAAQLAGESGRIGMIMKASPFFSKDQHAVDARQALLRKLKPAALINLSALRKEDLFPNAKGPALLFFARCALLEDGDRILVGSIPWTPDFRRNGVFHVGPSELKSVSLSRILRTPSMLKAASFGTVRDGWLIEKLEQRFPTLEKILDEAQLAKRGQGFQVQGGDINQPPAHYYQLKVITTESYTPLRIRDRQLAYFDHDNLHRVRDPDIFKGPLLICPKGAFMQAAALGRYSAAFSPRGLLYNKSFFGISFAGKSQEGAKVLCAILNSSVVAFQLAFGGSVWGLERPTVEPGEIMALRMPDLSAANPTLLQKVLEAEQLLAGEPNNAAYLAKLDAVVCDLYDLDRAEAALVNESVARARMFLFDGREQRMAFVKVPPEDALTAYATQVVNTVNAYLRARGKQHLEAVIYPRRIARGNMTDGVPGVTAVRFAMVAGAPIDQPVIHQGTEEEVERLATFLRGQGGADIPPYLNERRQLRVYHENDLFVLKPSEVRYWTQAAGLNDADVILADHWVMDRHASVA